MHHVAHHVETLGRGEPTSQLRCSLDPVHPEGTNVLAQVVMTDEVPAPAVNHQTVGIYLTEYLVVFEAQPLLRADRSSECESHLGLWLSGWPAVGDYRRTGYQGVHPFA